MDDLAEKEAATEGAVGMVAATEVAGWAVEMAAACWVVFAEVVAKGVGSAAEVMVVVVMARVGLDWEGAEALGRAAEAARVLESKGVVATAGVTVGAAKEVAPVEGRADSSAGAVTVRRRPRARWWGCLATCWLP